MITDATYVYDALGRRYSRAAGGSTRYFVYGPGGLILEQLGGNYTEITIGNGLVRRGTEYPMFDGLGSERTVRDSSQNSVGSITIPGCLLLIL